MKEDASFCAPRCLFCAADFLFFEERSVPLLPPGVQHIAMTKQSKSVLRLTQLGLLSALSVVIGLFKFPILPIAPYLEFDFADTPIIIASLLFGTLPGLAVLLVVSLIQAFLLGGNGIIGFIMHFAASGVLLVTIKLIAGKAADIDRLRIGRIITALVCGTLAMTLMMIPLNFIFTPILFSVEREFVAQMLLPAIIPFNLIKAGVNSVLSCLLYRLLGKRILSNTL